MQGYTVVWTPKHSLQEMLHLMQTNPPAVTGLARLGDRRGLRVKATQTKSIHQLVRPDSFWDGGLIANIIPKVHSRICLWSHHHGL